MNFNLIAFAGLATGLLAACWSYFKALCLRCVSLLVVRAKLEGNVGAALSFYCFRNMWRSPLGNKRYDSYRGFVRPLQRYQVIGFERIGSDATVFWQGWRPLSLSLFEGNIQTPHASQGVNVTFIRGTFDLDQLLVAAIDLYNHDQQDGDKRERFEIERVFGFGSLRARKDVQGNDIKSSGSPLLAKEGISPEWRLLRWQKEDVGADSPANPWGALAFTNEVEALIHELQHWKASERWYRGKRIPWRRGVLLHGRPGTGKTSFARALAQELDVPLVAFDLTTFGNNDFSGAWRQLMSRAPCIALLEDIDAVFCGRENRLGEEGGGLSFDCLLNCLSGVESADGVIVIITTNRIEDLDEAIGIPNEQGVSTRPGRIDRVVELLPLDASCRRRVAQRILEDCPQEITAAVAAGEGETGAQFQERCSQIALSNYWQALQDNRDVA